MPVDGKRVDVLRERDVVLNRSVKRHLVADVPVGLLLSGGIDSSLIASYIKDNSNIKCFTVDFGDNQDEIQNAKAIATCFGLKLEILELRDSVSFERYLEIIQKMPEPIGDSSFIPVYLITEMIRKQGITVVLTGDGADELFAGYSLYKYLLVIYKWFRILSFLNRFTSIISYGLPVKIKKWFDAVKALKNGYHPNLRAFFSPDEIFNITGHRIKFQEKFKGKNLLKQFMLDDFKNYLSLGLLFKNDSASMANSIELRSPFLDNEVYEFVKNNVPTRELLFKGQNKSLLREHAGNVFPSDYSFNSKRGFNFANSIISDDFYQQCLYYINANLKGEKKISSLLKKAKDGNVRDFHRFHILFVFMIWNSKNT
jgi:asparagine synthase (glutamine-hydrolysing)